MSNDRQLVLRVIQQPGSGNRFFKVKGKRHGRVRYFTKLFAFDISEATRGVDYHDRRKHGAVEIVRTGRMIDKGWVKSYDANWNHAFTGLHKVVPASARNHRNRAAYIDAALLDPGTEVRIENGSSDDLEFRLFIRYARSLDFPAYIEF